MTVYVSLLRGVNVGGHRKLTSQALAAAYSSLGFGGARAVLQSGNVVFASAVRDRAGLAKRIAQELERRLELDIEVLLRSREEIRTIVERSPLLGPGADYSKLVVMFLAAVPPPVAQAALVRGHAGPELIELRGPEVYLSYPDGAGRSKLSGAFIERVLDTAGTARNWNTILKLLDAANAVADA
jgi:uncharacterized protein (DUF1697 family)